MPWDLTPPLAPPQVLGEPPQPHRLPLRDVPAPLRRPRGRQRVPPAMLEQAAGAAVDRLETDLDLGHMAAAVQEVVEDQPLPRLPRRDAPEVEALAGLPVPHLDPSATDAGLEADPDGTLGVLPAVPTALLPAL